MSVSVILVLDLHHLLCTPPLLTGLGGHQDVVQSCCWSGNGSVVASVCKVCWSVIYPPSTLLCLQFHFSQKERQKSIKLFDPRQSTNHVQVSSLAV